MIESISAITRAVRFYRMLGFEIINGGVRLQRLRLACRSGARLIPILATRQGRARPGSSCLWTDILNPL